MEEMVIGCFMTAHLAVLGWLLLTVLKVVRAVDHLTEVIVDLPRIKKDIAQLQDWRKGISNGLIKPNQPH